MRSRCVGALGVALVLFVLLSATLADVWHDRVAITDVPVYRGYGDAIERGELPYRDFRPEYPPLALAPFSAPSLVTRAGDGYARAFAIEMAVLGLVLIVLVAAVLRRLRLAGYRMSSARLALLVAAPLLLGPLLLTRFDLLPATLTVAVVLAALAGRPLVASALAGLAVAAKIYPVVLVPILVVLEWRRRGWRAGARVVFVTGGVLALVYLPFLVLAPHGVASSLWRQLSRPLQIESLGAGILLAASRVAGGTTEVVSSYGSQNLEGASATALATGTSLLQIAMLVTVWVLTWRSSTDERLPETLVVSSAAAVSAFVAFGKVLSPQFLIWLLPLVVLVPGRRGLVAIALVAVACLLTRGWFPSRYWALVDERDDLAVTLVVLRDLVLVALSTLLAMGIPRGRSSDVGSIAPATGEGS